MSARTQTRCSHSLRSSMCERRDLKREVEESIVCFPDAPEGGGLISYLHGSAEGGWDGWVRNWGTEREGGREGGRDGEGGGGREKEYARAEAPDTSRNSARRLQYKINHSFFSCAGQSCDHADLAGS